MSKKGPDIILTASILIGALIVAAAVAFVIVKRGAAPHSALPPPPGGIVAAQAAMQECTAGDACIMIDSSCGMCCKFIAINAKAEASYAKIFGDSCANFTGNTCSCTEVDSYPACINGKCVLVPWREK
jgi:hypothetical protein